MGKNASDDIATTPEIERQQSINDFSSCILDE